MIQPSHITDLLSLADEAPKAKIAADLDAVKERARAVANELRDMGFDVFCSYGHSHGLTEWDVYEAGSDSREGMVGSVWYDSYGVILKGDRLQEMAGGGALQTWA